MSYELEAFGGTGATPSASTSAGTRPPDFVKNPTGNPEGATLGSKSGELASKRTPGLGPTGFAYRFPQNTDGHAAFVDIDIFGRLSGGFKNALSGELPITKDRLGNIKLYMPQAISFSDGLTYDNTELTGITSAIAASANEALNGGGVTGGAVVLGQSLKGLASDFAARNSAAGAAAAVAAGVAINPRASMLFKAPTFRQLALSFKLIPSNSRESTEIENIIHVIRQHTYPELIAGGASFQYPNVFKIGFVSLSGPNPWIMPFAHAYCTAITVNYNSTSPAIMKDGAPNEVDLTLNFQETKVLDRAAIAKMGKRTGLSSDRGIG